MRILKELLWVLVAVLLSIIVLMPIVKEINYKYLYLNVFIILLSVFYVKTILEFHTSIFFDNKWVKLFSFSFNLFLLVFLVAKVQQNLVLFDSFTISTYSNTVSIMDPTKESDLIKYINTEFLFFGILTIVGLLGLNIKLVKSLWSKLTIKDY